MAHEVDARDTPRLSPPGVVKAMVDLTRGLDNLTRDLALLRARIDAGDAPRRLYPVLLSATLFVSEMSQSLARALIALANEEG